MELKKKMKEERDQFDKILEQQSESEYAFTDYKF